MSNEEVSVFQSCASKVLRAREHFDDLNRRILEFFAEKPYMFKHVRGEQPRHFKVLIGTRKTPDIRLGIIAGEVVHQLRSALDYSIGESIWSATGHEPEPDHKFQFPIFLADTKRNARMFDGYVRGITDAARAVLREIQPYRSGHPERATLWLLHCLDNEDKHRFIHIVSGSAGVRRFSHTGKGGAVSLIGKWITDPDVFPVEDGAVVLEYLSKDTKADVDVEIETYVAFENPSVARGIHVLDFLSRAIAHVTAILGRLTAIADRDGEPVTGVGPN